VSDLSTKEEGHVRTALKFLRVRVGAWKVLSKSLRFHESTLAGVAAGRKAVSGTMAVRIAKFAKVGVDDILNGRFPAAGTCPYCGHQTALKKEEQSQ